MKGLPSMKLYNYYITCSFEKISLTKNGELLFFNKAKNIYSEVSSELFKFCNVNKFNRAHAKKCIYTIAHILKCMVKAILPHKEHIVGMLGFQMFVSRDANWLSREQLAAEFGNILELLKDHGYIDKEIDGFNNRNKPSESTKGYILFRYANAKQLVEAARLLFHEKKLKKVKNNPYVDIRKRGILTYQKIGKKGNVIIKKYETWVSDDLSHCANQKELKQTIRQTKKIENFIKKATYSIPINYNLTTNEELTDYIRSYNYNENIKDNTKINLYRIFHDDFEHSGRYYGKYHCYMPKEYRKKILINDEKTVQLDFKSCIPSILYVQSGNTLDNNQDMYCVDSLNIPREYLKYIFVCALNSPSISTACKAIRNEYWRNPEIFPDFREEYLSAVPADSDIKEWFNKILKQYPYLKEYFFNPEQSLVAINKESRIITEIYSRCIEESIQILDVYDCILCQECNQDRVQNIMKKACISIIGQELNIEIE